MKPKRIILTGLIILLITQILVVFTISFGVKTKIKESFKLNKTLQQEGYYMGDFEFKLLGFAYYLDKGHYLKAYMMLSRYHKNLKNREGLVKIPEFKNHQDEITFYLNLQNPNTGAFIDESTPFCTYWSVTENIINHIEILADSSTTPLKLKYPLKFLDEINTPEKLTAFLEDVSYVSRLASKFPQTSFLFARNISGESTSEDVLERYHLYNFSPEWKHTWLKWMYDFQDSTTGLWGPKNRKTNKLTKLDLNNTASILKSFRDNEGNDLHKEFPLKYRDKLFKSAIGQLSEPFPGQDDPDEIHEWNLRQTRGINMLLRHLWKDASEENKKSVEKIILRNIDICFEMYYIKDEGAFSYYPKARHASCDGITNLILDDIGALSYKKQNKLWGDPAENAKDMGEISMNELKTSDLDPIMNFPGINSIRIYRNKPDYKHLTNSVWAVYYPKETQVLDIMELIPNIVQWTETSTLSMGNWISMAEIKKEFLKLNIEKPLIYRNKLSFTELNTELIRAGEFYIVGFDKLQVPRCKIKFRFSNT